MILAVSNPLEIRGVVNKVTQKGKPYFVINVEDADGYAHSLYCPKVEALPLGLKKCDKVFVTFSLGSWNGQERYTVEKVEKAEGIE